MTVAEAGKLKQLIHARKFGYKVWMTTDFSALFGYVEKVTTERVFLRESDLEDIPVDEIKTIKPFYDYIKLEDELDS